MEAHKRSSQPGWDPAAPALVRSTQPPLVPVCLRSTSPAEAEDYLPALGHMPPTEVWIIIPNGFRSASKCLVILLIHLTNTCCVSTEGSIGKTRVTNPAELFALAAGKTPIRL